MVLFLFTITEWNCRSSNPLQLNLNQTVRKTTLEDLAMLWSYAGKVLLYTVGGVDEDGYPKNICRDFSPRQLARSLGHGQERRNATGNI